MPPGLCWRTSNFVDLHRTLELNPGPVFIDSDPVTLNGKVEQLEEAYSPGKTKAVLMAHTLGNPFNVSAVTQFCQKHELWLIEDNCDAWAALTTASSREHSAIYPRSLFIRRII